MFEANGRALVGAGDKGGSYRAFDRATGEPVWQTKLELGPMPQFGGVTVTAAVQDDTIYVASNHLESGSFVTTGEHDPNDYSILYALDTASGQPRWTQKLPAPMAGTFALANGVLYHTVVNRTFFARDVKTGSVLWSAMLGNDPGSGVSVVNGRVYVSAGMALTAILPTELGGFVSSFGLEEGPVVVREARVDMLEPLTEAQCKTKLDFSEVSDVCSSCLCECDPTAAGHCGSCSTLAVCAAVFCAFSAPGDETRDCLANFCNAKLLPSYVFDRAVDAAPCLTQCALACSL